MNIINFLYLFFRLGPFIIVCFFSLQSILNSDLRGVMYLAGLLIASFVTFCFGKAMRFDKYTASAELCKTITLGEVPGSTLSDLPLSQTVFGYTFGYLMYFIIQYQLYSQNIATFVLFPLFIVFDMGWNCNYECLGEKNSTLYKLGVSLTIGLMVGAAWAAIIVSTKVPGLQYFNGISNKDVCNRPTKGMFRCRAPTSK